MQHSDPMQNHLASKVWACEESTDFFFSLSLLLSSFAFLASFFSVARHFVGYISVGKVFGKASRLLGLDARKGKWMVEQDFHGDFRVNVTCFVCPFLGAP